MRKITAIFLMLLYLGAYTELHQFLRLPLFFTHYKEHRQQAPEMTLVGYFIIHYFTQHSNAADSQEHQSLPFKAYHTHVPFSFVLPNDSSICMLGNPPVRTEKMSTSTISVVASSFVATIWQPPRA